MRHFRLTFAGFLLLLIVGCAEKSQEDKSDVTGTSEGDNAESGVPKEFPGMKGIEGESARAKAKIARNKLRMIGLGSLNYLDTINSYPFPAGSNDLPESAKGKLSWRVQILPYIDQSELFEQFHLEEPWDSEHNRKLLEQMPDIFKLSDETKPGYTQYVTPSGPGYIAEGMDAKKQSRLSDASENILMVVTVKPELAVPWTKPEGLELDPSHASEILGGDPNGFLGLFADGSTKTLDPKMDPDLLKALLTVAGGEPLDETKLPPHDFPPLNIESDQGVSKTIE